jgi:septal ring factor EnvC (AmiA/AmiB activator)
MRFLIIFFSILLFASNANVKKELKNTKKQISKMNLYLAKLAKEIKNKQQEINKINNKMSQLNSQINKLKKELQNSNQTINELYDLKKGYLEKLQNIQNQITYFLSTNYYISNEATENVNDLINQEVTKEILKKYSKKISSLAKEQVSIKSKINKISNKISQILSKQKLLIKKRNKLLILKQKRQKELKSLANKKKIYKNKLYAMIQKQKNLQNKLKELSIIKTTKHQNYLPTKTYKGIKTIAPVRGKIIKNFGSYIDPIYKFKVYNDSITIKPYQKNAIIRAIMPGRVVYIDKKRGIIILKHKNYLFSIYANLSKISPILKKGSFVKRGQII